MAVQPQGCVLAAAYRPRANAALCTMGRSGKDLHYRGYDILNIADRCEFEEVAYLLVHGKLPNAVDLAAYKPELKSMRGLPVSVKQALEHLPAGANPMDVMRAGVSALGCVLPEKDDRNIPARATSPTACWRL